MSVITGSGQSCWRTGFWENEIDDSQISKLGKIMEKFRSLE